MNHFDRWMTRCDRLAGLNGKDLLQQGNFARITRLARLIHAYDRYCTENAPAQVRRYQDQD